MSNYISVQTSFGFPLSSVKPLDSLQSYREHCISATRRVLEGSRGQRRNCPACDKGLSALGKVADLGYVHCLSCESVFLNEVPDSALWAGLLADVSRYRQSPEAFHYGITQSRIDNVYGPKLEWMQSTLRLRDIRSPRLMEVVTPPSDFTPLLRGEEAFKEVLTLDEMKLASGERPNRSASNAIQTDEVERADAAILLESLDRADDPAKLLHAVVRRLTKDGLLFVTAAVCSGFDMKVLGLRNRYLYPPDRANCFSLKGLELLLTSAGLSLLEVSTPGVLDVEVVLAHLQQDPLLPLSAFEKQLLATDEETRETFQTFLQQNRMSSFARIVAVKHS